MIRRDCHKGAKSASIHQHVVRKLFKTEAKTKVSIVVFLSSKHQVHGGAIPILAHILQLYVLNNLEMWLNHM